MLDAGLGAETRGPHDTELQVAGDMGEASAWTIMQTRRYQAGLPAGASACCSRVDLLSGPHPVLPL